MQRTTTAKMLRNHFNRCIMSYMIAAEVAFDLGNFALNRPAKETRAYLIAYRGNEAIQAWTRGGTSGCMA